jgi:hypothetical protein
MRAAALLHADQGEYPFKPLVIKPGQHRLLWDCLLDLNSAITLSEMSCD